MMAAAAATLLEIFRAARLQERDSLLHRAANAGFGTFEPVYGNLNGGAARQSGHGEQ